MIIHLGHKIILFLFFVRSFAGSGSLWPWSEDECLPSTDFSWNRGALALSDFSLPSDPTSLFSDISDLLLENSQVKYLFISDNPDLISDQSFKTADCSASSSPSFGNRKSRAKRIDGPTRCSNRDSQFDHSSPLWHDLSDIIKKLDERQKTAPAIREEQNQNGLCRALTSNVLPWGACSNPNRFNTQYRAPSLLIQDLLLAKLQLYDLLDCVICKFRSNPPMRPNDCWLGCDFVSVSQWESTCLTEKQKFYCCQAFIDGQFNRFYERTEPYGEACVPFSILQAKFPAS